MTPSVTIEEQLQVMKGRVELRLAELFPSGRTNLYAAANYSLLGGGKRLRPLLALAAAEALGAPPEKGLNAACALELVHTYSLIHDDLPCMDDDDLRRGRPTLHRVFTEANALLAGDLLLTYAFELISCDPQLSDHQKVVLARILAQKSGGEGMIGGQLQDLEAEGKAISYEELCTLHKKKSGALLAASLQFGGVVASAPKEMISLLGIFGERCGLAFQLVDDILDVTATEAELGKTAASDIANNKATSVTTVGIDKARAHAERLLAESKELLAPHLKESGLLFALADKLVRRSY